MSARSQNLRRSAIVQSKLRALGERTKSELRALGERTKSELLGRSVSVSMLSAKSRLSALGKF